MHFQYIEKSVHQILSELPAHIELVAAAKTRTAEEVRAAVEAGVRIIGYNYVQEAERIRPQIPYTVKWHMIGHLQRNKARKALELFDMVETLDSVRLAQVIDKIGAEKDRVIPVLIEVNSGREKSKTGVFPEELESLIRNISSLKYLKVMGLMTMGPLTVDPQSCRPFFKITRAAFDELRRLAIPGVEVKYLSMGMSDSYRIAIEEGANMIRIGTKLFGPRD